MIKSKSRDVVRPAIARMAHIRGLLVSGQPFNATSVANELEVSSKTVHRDIEFMRDRLGYDMEFSAPNKTWKGTPPAKAIL